MRKSRKRREYPPDTVQDWTQGFSVFQVMHLRAGENLAILGVQNGRVFNVYPSVLV